MDWRAIDLHGAASISRVVNVFEIRDMRGIPWTKYKIKVLEEGSGRFLAIANVSVKNANGTPDGEAGLGRTEVEARIRPANDVLRGLAGARGKADPARS
jgi:hypothetical protein